METDKELVWDILSTPSNADFKKFREEHSQVWLTKERKIVLIKNMEISHIISCINMLERLEQQYTQAYEGLIEELRTRGMLYDHAS